MGWKRTVEHTVSGGVVPLVKHLAGSTAARLHRLWRRSYEHGWRYNQRHRRESKASVTSSCMSSVSRNYRGNRTSRLPGLWLQAADDTFSMDSQGEGDELVARAGTGQRPSALPCRRFAWLRHHRGCEEWGAAISIRACEECDGLPLDMAYALRLSRCPRGEPGNCVVVGSPAPGGRDSRRRRAPGRRGAAVEQQRGGQEDEWVRYVSWPIGFAA
jgi:hypothetical protein